MKPATKVSGLASHANVSDWVWAAAEPSRARLNIATAAAVDQAFMGKSFLQATVVPAYSVTGTSKRECSAQPRPPNLIMTEVIRWARTCAVGCAVVAIGLAGRSCGTFLVVEKTVERPDAILSLASHEWERLPEAARLAAQNPDARVLLTLPPLISDVNCHDCSHRLAHLARMGVAADRVTVLPLKISGTYGEALVALPFVRKAGIHRLLIVTSPYHTRRALATFQKVFAGSGTEIGIHPVGATVA